MEQINLKIEDISNISSIKNMETNNEENSIITSVINNGLKVPIRVDKKHNVLDGYLRVKGCIEANKETIEAFVIDGDEAENYKDVYIVNDARIEPTAVKKADCYMNAIKNKSENEENDICLSLGVKINKNEMKISKAHKSKYKAIHQLPIKVKEKLHFYRIGINTSYEIAKAYLNEESKLSVETILSILKHINDNKLSEKASLSYIKSFKKSESKSSKKDDKEEEHLCGVEFRKTIIRIDVSKHFQDEAFTFEKVSEEHKIQITQFIDKVFTYLKDNHYKDKNSDESQNKDTPVLEDSAA